MSKPSTKVTRAEFDTLKAAVYAIGAAIEKSGSYLINTQRPEQELIRTREVVARLASLESHVGIKWQDKPNLADYPRHTKA